MVRRVREFATLADLKKSLDSERLAARYLRRIRWPEGPSCPHCNCRDVYRFKNGVLLKCSGCRKRFTVRTGTLFENSKIPLRKWIFATWLVTSPERPISGTRLSRELKITQRSAWEMQAFIRRATPGLKISIGFRWVWPKGSKARRPVMRLRYDDKLSVDMTFLAALARFCSVDRKRLRGRIKLWRKENAKVRRIRKGSWVR